MTQVDTAGRDYARVLADAFTNTPQIVAKKGTVTAVTAGTSVTVTVEGNSLACPYLGTAPSVGDIVRVELRDGSPLVIDRIVGVTAA